MGENGTGRITAISDDYALINDRGAGSIYVDKLTVRKKEKGCSYPYGGVLLQIPTIYRQNAGEGYDTSSYIRILFRLLLFTRKKITSGLPGRIQP